MINATSDWLRYYMRPCKVSRGHTVLASDHLYFDAILTLLDEIVEGEETEVDRHKLLACVEAVRVEAEARFAGFVNADSDEPPPVHRFYGAYPAALRLAAWQVYLAGVSEWAVQDERAAVDESARRRWLLTGIEEFKRHV